MTVEEVVVVEGRDDTRALKAALDCETIETHGFGITAKTWARLDSAYKKKGLIVMTDPDHAGSEIRKRLLERYPESKEVFLPRTKATKDSDIGVENAAPNDIIEAFKKAKIAVKENAEIKKKITLTDLVDLGLAGAPGSRELREIVGDELGIGYANAKTMLTRLTHYGISPKELNEALRTANDKIHKE